MRNRKTPVVRTILVVALLLFVRTLFYKTVCLLLLFALWRKPLMEKVPEPHRQWAAWTVWVSLILLLVVALPRWRIHTNDRVRLVYLDKQGEVKPAPIAHWVASALLPEAEIGNLGLTGVRLSVRLDL